MNKNENIDYWIELSEYDLETAKVMLTGKRYLYVGFMCHQTIEKALKACFVKLKQDNPPFIHNLTRLANNSEMYIQMSDAQKDILDILEPLNIEARYPTHKEKLMKSLNEERCNKIIIQTEELLLWIKKRLLIE